MNITMHNYGDGTYGGAVPGWAYLAEAKTPDRRMWTWYLWRGTDRAATVTGTAPTLKACRNQIREYLK